MPHCPITALAQACLKPLFPHPGKACSAVTALEDRIKGNDRQENAEYPAMLKPDFFIVETPVTV
jgi:hypothetical protein